MADFGGIMRLSLGSTQFKIRGTFNIDPSGLTVTAITNQDGSNSRTFKPDGYGADLKSLENQDGIDWNALMKAPRVGARIVEETTGRLHIFSNAFLVGSPVIDTETGEVTGLSLKADAYQQSNN